VNDRGFYEFVASATDSRLSEFPGLGNSDGVRVSHGLGPLAVGSPTVL
jgi:hypothetical protein